jgi:hypothetical protein
MEHSTDEKILARARDRDRHRDRQRQREGEGDKTVAYIIAFAAFAS